MAKTYPVAVSDFDAGRMDCPIDDLVMIVVLSGVEILILVFFLGDLFKRKIRGYFRKASKNCIFRAIFALKKGTLADIFWFEVEKVSILFFFFKVYFPTF